MSQTSINEAIENNNIAYLIDVLEAKDLDITSVEAIYKSNISNKDIVAQVAMNLSLRTSVYNRETQFSPVMVSLLKEIAINPIDMGARWAVAKNPHTPIETLKLLSKDKINLVRALVATNPSTPTTILEKFFSDEKIVRDGLSGNISTPLKILKILAHDNDKMVRMRLAENPSSNIEILNILKNDSEPNVVLAAKAHIKADQNES